MRYENRDGLGPPMRKNDHACKALGYLLGGPYGQMAFDRAVNDYQPISYVGESFYTRRPSGTEDSADYIWRR